MPIYDYRCSSGDHRFESLAPMGSTQAPCCPACGAGSTKVPSRVALGGGADPGRPQELMPQTWRGTQDGDREYIGSLRREWEKRERLEERHPELQGDRRPVLAHEGRYEGAPLRKGDAAVAAAPGPAPAPHAHATHPHPHPHP